MVLAVTATLCTGAKHFLLHVACCCCCCPGCCPGCCLLPCMQWLVLSISKCASYQQHAGMQLGLPGGQLLLASAVLQQELLVTAACTLYCPSLLPGYEQPQSQWWATPVALASLHLCDLAAAQDKAQGASSPAKKLVLNTRKNKQQLTIRGRWCTAYAGEMQRLLVDKGQQL